MTSTPLSDIISQLLANSNPGSLLYDTFVEAFRRSTVGVVTLTALSNRRPGEIFAAQANEVSVATVLTPDGRQMVKACADPSVFAQRYPDTAIGALVLGEDVLRMVAEPSSNVEGVAVCSATSFHSVSITRAEAISRIAKPLSARAPAGDGTFVVSPGHQVRIVFPQVVPSFGQLACGVWVLNFGESRHIPAGLHTVSEFVSRSERASVLWVLAGDVLDGVTDHGFFLDACTDILQCAAHVRHFAVFPDIMPSRSHLMRLFKERGFGVHFGGPHRECLVEALKPDGTITVAMAGPEFTLVDKS